MDTAVMGDEGREDHDVRVQAWLAVLVSRLEADPDLAAAFERTPGKVAVAVGVPHADVAAVLQAFGGAKS